MESSTEDLSKQKPLGQTSGNMFLLVMNNHVVSKMKKAEKTKKQQKTKNKNRSYLDKQNIALFLWKAPLASVSFVVVVVLLYIFHLSRSEI